MADRFRNPASRSGMSSTGGGESIADRMAKLKQNSSSRELRTEPDTKRPGLNRGKSVAELSSRFNVSNGPLADKALSQPGNRTMTKAKSARFSASPTNSSKNGDKACAPFNRSASSRVTSSTNKLATTPEGSSLMSDRARKMSALSFADRTAATRAKYDNKKFAMSSININSSNGSGKSGFTIATAKSNQPPDQMSPKPAYSTSQLRSTKVEGSSKRFDVKTGTTSTPAIDSKRSGFTVASPTKNSSTGRGKSGFTIATPSSQTASKPAYSTSNLRSTKTEGASERVGVKAGTTAFISKQPVTSPAANSNTGSSAPQTDRAAELRSKFSGGAGPSSVARSGAASPKKTGLSPRSSPTMASSPGATSPPRSKRAQLAATASKPSPVPRNGLKQTPGGRPVTRPSPEEEKKAVAPYANVKLRKTNSEMSLTALGGGTNHQPLRKAMSEKIQKSPGGGKPALSKSTPDKVTKSPAAGGQACKARHAATWSKSQLASARTATTPRPNFGAKPASPVRSNQNDPSPRRWAPSSSDPLPASGRGRITAPSGGGVTVREKASSFLAAGVNRVRSLSRSLSPSKASAGSSRGSNSSTNGPATGSSRHSNYSSRATSGASTASVTFSNHLTLDRPAITGRRKSPARVGVKKVARKNFGRTKVTKGSLLSAPLATPALI